MRDIFVVARDRQSFEMYRPHTSQAWDFEWKHGMVHFVDSWEQLRGIAPARVFLVGQYQKRPDWALIRAQIEESKHRPLVLR